MPVDWLGVLKGIAILALIWVFWPVISFFLGLFIVFMVILFLFSYFGGSRFVFGKAPSFTTYRTYRTSWSGGEEKKNSSVSAFEPAYEEEKEQGNVYVWEEDGEIIDLPPNALKNSEKSN